MLVIGRALVGGPKVLLLDEPLEGLASIVVETLIAALAAIRDDSGVTMILAEQKADLACPSPKMPWCSVAAASFSAVRVPSCRWTRRCNTACWRSAGDDRGVKLRASAAKRPFCNPKAEIPRCPSHVRGSEANCSVVELSLTRKW